jgi:serine/threonine protein kinase
MSIVIGQTISHYRITGRLGSGGMGVVYKAEDTNLDRTVALKFLAAHLLESHEHKQRFLREAKAASSLDHPNICMVHEVGEADGQVFFAMSYIDGPELRAKIRERPLKLDEALDIAMQAGEGLRAAHRQGVVHRDIKSSNLMLSSSGQVKIMDFGLAQLTGGTRLTRTETVLGTPAYMSPEQAQRLPTDSRTDIWSLGIVLYEMVTGRLPFEGESLAAVVRSIVEEQHEPITALRAGAPTELDRIVGKALAKNPAERYQHVDDLLVDLRALRNNLSAPVSATRPAPRRRWLWPAVVPLLVVAAVLVWLRWPPPGGGEPLRAVALTTSPGVERYPSFSPEGNHVTFTWTGPKQDNPDIYVLLIGSGSPLRLTSDPRTDYNPVWSPDGRWIAFLRSESPVFLAQGGKSELLLIPPLGGPERKVAEIRTRAVYSGWPTYLTWCPDNTCLIATDSVGEGKPDALFVVSFESGEKRQLTSPQPPVLGDTDPAVSPDGSSLIFRRHLAALAAELYWVPLERGFAAEGEPKRLALAAQDVMHPTWMPDGKEILFSTRESLWRLAVAAQSPPVRLPFIGEEGVMPVVSRPPPGRPTRLVYVRMFGDDDIWRIETSAPGAPSSSPPSVVISSTQNDYNPQLSPDGRRVAFASRRSGKTEVWLSDTDGANAIQLTSMDAPFTGTPRWSPDGEMIVFHSNLESQFEIYVIAASGGKPRRLTSHTANDEMPSFSHDGRWIYFGSNRTGEYQVWKAPASGGEAIQVTDNGGYVAFESPDGAYIYYTQVPRAASALWRLPSSGGQSVKLLEGVVMRAFVVLEGGIYYIDQPSGQARLQFYDLVAGGSTTVAPNLGEIWAGLTATSDGRTILYSRVTSPDDLMLVENFR